MAKDPKNQLKALSSLLGVDLGGDAEVRVYPADADGKMVRIKSLGANAYDIATSPVISKPKKDLAVLERLTGLDLQGDATVVVSPSEGVSKTLRIKSIGANAYDISVG